MRSRRGSPAGSRRRRHGSAGPVEARATLDEFSGPDHRGAIANARAVISLVDGDPETALGELRDIRDNATPGLPGFTLVEAHLLAGAAHLRLDEPHAAAAAAEAALEAAEP